MAVTADMRRINRCPAAVLALNAALCDRSSSTRASNWSLSASETPPIKSEAFSRCASNNAASSLAPFLVEHVDRGAFRVGASIRVGMNRDEEIRVRLVRDLHSLAMRDEIVAVAHEHGAHAGLRVDLGRELARDREHDILLPRAAATARAGILAAVPRVDRDDDVATAIGRRLRRAAHDGRRLRRRQIHDEAVAVLVVRREQERLRFGRLVELEHEAQLAARPRTRAQRRDGALRLGQIEAGRGRGARQIDDHAIGTGQREHAMLDGPAQLEDDAGAFRTGPRADVLHGGGRRGAANDEERHDYAEPQPHPSRHLCPTPRPNDGLMFTDFSSSFQCFPLWRQRITACY